MAAKAPVRPNPFQKREDKMDAKSGDKGNRSAAEKALEKKLGEKKGK